MAIKMLRGGQMSTTAVQRELEVLSRLRHPRLLSLLGLCRDLPSHEGSVALVTELMERGSLFHCLHEDNASAATADAASDSGAWLGATGMTAVRLRCALDVAEGMRFLHAMQVVHRDLKSANVLVDGDGRCKIADFGLSAFRDAGATHVTGLVGTAAWTAPEVLLGEAARPTADMYSFGVVLWELWAGRQPWVELSGGMVQIITAVAVQGKRLPLLGAGDNAVKLPASPAELQSLLARCFGPQEARPTFEEVCTLLQEQLAAVRRAEDERLREAPDYFLCAIGMSLMRDPVMAADGHSYERALIEDWLRQSDRSPKTNLPLASRTLTPNHALRSAIDAYAAKHGGFDE